MNAFKPEAASVELTAVSGVSIQHAMFARARMSQGAIVGDSESPGEIGLVPEQKVLIDALH